MHDGSIRPGNGHHFFRRVSTGIVVHVRAPVGWNHGEMASFVQDIARVRQACLVYFRMIEPIVATYFQVERLPSYIVFKLG